MGILADSMGVDQGTMYDMISKGQISGGTAVNAILTALSRDSANGGYAGSMAEQSKTFSGRSSTLEGWQQEMQYAAGEAYNSIRGAGIAQQNAYYEGIADSMSEMNGILGESKAYLENLNEQYGREAMTALLTGAKTTLYEPMQADKLQKMHETYNDLLQQYQNAEETDKAGLGAKIQALKDEAESMAESAYNTSTGMQEVKDVQIELISAIRENTDALGRGAWGYDYEIAQESSKGMGSALGRGLGGLGGGDADGGWYDEGGNFHPYAYGLSHVPYDNFPTLLHQGERVLTASQARQADRTGGSVSVTFTGPVTVREEADLDKLARKFAQRVQRAALLAVPG